MKCDLSLKKMEKYCAGVSLVLKALAHPRRIMILSHLSKGSKSVGDLVKLCRISQPQMSHFLARMALEGLVRAERNGQFRMYSIRDERLKNLLMSIQKEYCGS